MLPKTPEQTRLIRYPRSMIAVTALIAIIPMLVRGPSCGHDFDFHLLSWLEAAQQFPHGSFPHWAYTPAFNAGEPRFIFYPPLSWSLGAILGLILPWTLVPAAFTWIALTLSGITFQAFARRYTSASAATLGGVLYLANPYMLFTAYERSAFAELLAAAWLPLLIAAALAPRVRIIPLAIPVALLWLTNAPAAVMSTYALAFLTLIRLALPRAAPDAPQPSSFPSHEPARAPSIAHDPAARNQNSRTRLHLALTTAAATALGLALAAFYILPAAYERRFVQIQMLTVEGMRISDHFLFHRMPGSTPDDRFHDAVVRTASLIAVALLAAIAAALFTLIAKCGLSTPTRNLVLHETSALSESRSFRPERGTASSFLAQWRNPRIWLSIHTPAILPLALLTLLIAFLLTPISLPVWTHLPDLAFLQFPWRLTALLGLILAFFTALALPRNLPSLRSSLLSLASVLIATLLIAPAWHLFHQHCDPEDTVPARVALFHSNLGTEPTDEYTPIDADPDALHPHDPPYWLIPPQDSYSWRNGLGVDAPPPAHANPGPSPAHLELNLATDEYLVLNRRKYPLWQVLLNGQPQSQDEAIHQRLLGDDSGSVAMSLPGRQDGLIVLKVPAGHSVVDLVFRHTPDESLGILISALALTIALVLLSYSQRKHRVPHSSRFPR